MSDELSKNQAQPNQNFGEPSREICVILPTYCERDNIHLVIDQLQSALKACDYQIIVVDDDSPDGTSEIVAALSQEDARINLIKRTGERGLAGACLAGMRAADAHYLAVMDADLQHDAGTLLKMLQCMRSERADIVVGARKMVGQRPRSGISPIRAIGSATANFLARSLLSIKLTDPMSGFFIIQRELLIALEPHLSGQGFKILADIIASAPHPLKIREISFEFGTRKHGQSKLDSLVIMDYLALLVAKLSGGVIPLRFVGFCLVGSLGLMVHLMALRTAMELTTFSFPLAQTLATLTAMISNFLLNNWLTYRDKRLHGWSLLSGFIRFLAVCSVGALANIAVGTGMFLFTDIWWLAGLAGALTAVFWNYFFSNAFIWNR